MSSRVGRDASTGRSETWGAASGHFQGGGSSHEHRPGASVTRFAVPVPARAVRARGRQLRQLRRQRRRWRNLQLGRRGSWLVGQSGTMLNVIHDRLGDIGHYGLDVDDDLLGIACRGTQEAWVVGSSGVILATIDAGKTWRVQDPGNGQTLRAVALAATSTVFVAGDGGVFRVTVDGGQNWRDADRAGAGVHVGGRPPQGRPGRAAGQPRGLSCSATTPPGTCCPGPASTATPATARGWARRCSAWCCRVTARPPSRWARAGAC